MHVMHLPAIGPWTHSWPSSKTARSARIRGSESMFAFPAIITLHTIGMGFLAGGSAVIDLRILGVAPHVPLKSVARFFPVLWLAFSVNAASGIPRCRPETRPCEGQDARLHGSD